MTTQRFKTCALAFVLCGVLGSQGCATGSEAYAWPAKVVSSDQLRPAEPLRLTIPRRNMNDPMPSGTAVLRVHVDELGIVRKTSLETSSGNAALDSAAQRTLVGAKFVPYREADKAVAVTTLMPMNVRASARCQGARPLDC
ncbi:MAG: energy transducer TonB [Pseudomonas sp.]|jgi:TonB family protein|uniref:energy transducer TonB n=1 Tax=Pseudomonas sp. TaxID=306 RepID=UPI0012050754|nr:energy transducer TonB [Pseudomonas sp.]RZI68244.1 MAG: energy transducer TonB [Pseudomonas sp.]